MSTDRYVEEPVTAFDRYRPYTISDAGMSALRLALKKDTECRTRDAYQKAYAYLRRYRSGYEALWRMQTAGLLVTACDQALRSYRMKYGTDRYDRKPLIERAIGGYWNGRFWAPF